MDVRKKCEMTDGLKESEKKEREVIGRTESGCYVFISFSDCNTQCPNASTQQEYI